MRTDRSTDRHDEAIAAFRKFANAPKIASFIAITLFCDYSQAYYDKGKLTVVASVNEVPEGNDCRLLM
jgi:hypothetical protein